MKSLEKQALGYALAAVFFWSTVATAFKISLRYLTPAELLFWSTLISLLLFSIFLWRTSGFSDVVCLLKRHPFQIFLLGMINPSVYYLALFHAYDLLPAQEAQAINYSWGLLLAWLSVPILGQRLRSRDFIAGLLCYFGVLVIATHGKPFSLEFHNMEGLFYALASTLLWALYWLFSTRIDSRPLPLLFLNFLVGVLLLAVYLTIMEERWKLPGWEGVAGAFYVGFFEMGFTFMLWLRAMKLAPSAAGIANLIYLSPFLSLFLIHYIVGEPILFSTIIGLMSILAGLMIQKRSGD